MSGSLVCVGIGLVLGAHITPQAEHAIKQADVVFLLASDPLVERWIEEKHEDVRSLQPFYKEGHSRLHTYKQMVEAILTQVNNGKRVCGVFYGHPGVFSWVPHRAIKLAAEAGFSASMLPGISSADCLYADLGIDPGAVGCQHYETTQFMLYERTIDPSAYLILWQVGVCGDRSLSKFSTSSDRLTLLVECLARVYKRTHQVTLYESPTLAVHKVERQKIRLMDLPTADIRMQTTLVIPPATDLKPNEFIQRVLGN